MPEAPLILKYHPSQHRCIWTQITRHFSCVGLLILLQGNLTRVACLQEPLHVGYSSTPKEKHCQRYTEWCGDDVMALPYDVLLICM